MGELGFEQVGATSLAVDNEGAIVLSKILKLTLAPSIFDIDIISFDNMYKKVS